MICSIYIVCFFQRETDSVRIKSKMIEDQTDTIRKLKEVIEYYP